jgi:hypothetical protein
MGKSKPNLKFVRRSSDSVRIKTSDDVRIVKLIPVPRLLSLMPTKKESTRLDPTLNARTHDSKACAEPKKSRALFIVADLLWCSQIFYHLLRHPV